MNIYKFNLPFEWSNLKQQLVIKHDNEYKHTFNKNKHPSNKPNKHMSNKPEAHWKHATPKMKDVQETNPWQKMHNSV